MPPAGSHYEIDLTVAADVASRYITVEGPKKVKLVSILADR